MGAATRKQIREVAMADPYLDGLSTSVDRWSSYVPAGDPLRDALLHVLIESAINGKGVTIGRVAESITQSEIVAASPRALELLGYPSVAAYAAAAKRDSFIYRGDTPVVRQKHRNKHPDIYDASLLRGDGGGYERFRLQGWSFLVDRTHYRVVLIWRPL
jgi:hypothetical protein